MWDAFCARFPYQETDDQLRAIADVLEDLTAGTPMDRLICGDVGFGKTEVAMRAAFVAAMPGVQVAVIAPTTLLARQHYKTFRRPLPGLSGRGAPACRASSRQGGGADPRRAGRRHRRHRHRHPRAAGQGVRFQNLGLLVIDEEQRFGVAHKERLKAAALGRPCADADRHADPAHAATVAVGRARSVDHRHAAGRPAGRSAPMSASSTGHDPRGAAARALSRRAELLRRAPDRGPAGDRGSCANRCPRSPSSSPMARWRRASSMTG
jgi:hypothetical protein